MNFSVASFSELPFSSTKASLSLACEAGSYTLTGQSATFQLVKSVSGGAGSYAIDGKAAAFDYARAISANAGSYAVTGQDASFDYDQVLSAEAGSYTIGGNFATFTIGKTIYAGAFSFLMTGQSANLEISRIINADAGSYAITGNDAEFTKGKSFICSAGAYTFTGYDATLKYSGEPAVVIETKGGVGKKRKTKADREKEQREELEAMVKREFDILDGTYVPEVVEAVKQDILPQIQQIDWAQYQIALAQVNALLLQAKIQMAEYESELDDEEALLMLL